MSSRAEKGEGSPDFLFSTRKCPADEVSGSCQLSSLPSVLTFKSCSEGCTQWWLGSRVRKSDMEGTRDIKGTG